MNYKTTSDAIKATLETNPNMDRDSMVVCPKCDGSGQTQPDITCNRCEGTGLLGSGGDDDLNF